MKNFNVKERTIEEHNAELKTVESNFELIQFTDSANFSEAQVAILPHGCEHDKPALLYLSEVAERPDLLELED